MTEKNVPAVVKFAVTSDDVTKAMENVALDDAEPTGTPLRRKRLVRYLVVFAF